MRLYCEGIDLSNAVMTVIKATSTKTTNPILEGIKLSADGEVLTLSATDGELAIEKKIQADVKLGGEVVVPGKLFGEFVKKLNSEQIELYVDEKNQLNIKYTDSIVHIQCQSAREFPKLQQIENAQFFEINQINFRKVIEKTVFSVAQDDTRPVLKGCLLEQDGQKLTAVALDGFRLAIAETDVLASSAESSIIVPARSLNEISKLLTEDEKIRVFVQRNYLCLQISGGRIESEKAAALYHAGKGTLTITGNPEFVGVTGIEIRAGQMTMTGGTVTGNGVPLDTKPNGNGSTTVGAGIAIVQHTTKLELSVSISGGTINGYTGLYESNVQNNADEDLQKITINVTGGTFQAINGGENAISIEDAGVVNVSISGETRRVVESE